VDHGLYYAGICRFLEFFPLSQIHLIWFEDIAEKPESVLADVYTFLGVDPSFRPAHMNRKQNASKMSRSKWLRDLSASIRIGLSGMGLSWVVKFLTRIGVAKIFSLINSRKIKYDKISLTDREWLLDHCREDMVKLQQLTGRDLSEWLKLQ
jgi:hypothetical protein